MELDTLIFLAVFGFIASFIDAAYFYSGTDVDRYVPGYGTWHQQGGCIYGGCVKLYYLCTGRKNGYCSNEKALPAFPHWLTGRSSFSTAYFIGVFTSPYCGYADIGISLHSF